MNRPADLAVIITGFFICMGLVSMTSYQYGYDTSKAECKPIIKREIPLKNMTFKQQVRNIQWQFKDKGAVR